MYYVSAKAVYERVINVHYYYYYHSAREVLTVRVEAQQEPFGPVFVCARTSVCG